MKRSSITIGMLTLACLLVLPGMAGAWCTAMGGYPSFEAQARAEARQRRAALAASTRQAALEERKQQKDRVVADQTGLKKAGYYRGEVNGRPGSALRTAVSEFRKANGFTAGTTLDEKGREILLGGTAVPKAAAKSCDAPQDELKNDQKALADLGFFKGAVDGCPSRMTSAAIRRFNEKHGFASNGDSLDGKARAVLLAAQVKALAK